MSTRMYSQAKRDKVFRDRKRAVGFMCECCGRGAAVLTSPLENVDELAKCLDRLNVGIICNSCDNRLG